MKRAYKLVLPCTQCHSQVMDNARAQQGHTVFENHGVLREGQKELGNTLPRSFRVGSEALSRWLPLPNRGYFWLMTSVGMLACSIGGYKLTRMAMWRERRRLDNTLDTDSSATTLDFEAFFQVLATQFCSTIGGDIWQVHALHWWWSNAPSCWGTCPGVPQLSYYHIKCSPTMH